MKPTAATTPVITMAAITPPKIAPELPEPERIRKSHLAPTSLLRIESSITCDTVDGPETSKCGNITMLTASRYTLPSMIQKIFIQIIVSLAPHSIGLFEVKTVISPSAMRLKLPRSVRIHPISCLEGQTCPLKSNVPEESSWVHSLLCKQEVIFEGRVLS